MAEVIVNIAAHGNMGAVFRSLLTTRGSGRANRCMTLSSDH
jgi:hypothetical protein